MKPALSRSLTVVAVGAGIVAILAWPSLLGGMFSNQGYMPHGHCYLWQPGLVALHVGSDALIGLAYLSISATLVYLVHRARADIPFNWIFLAFGTFILACGATHFMSVWNLWVPSYWLSGNVKLLTALASVTTAIVLPPLVPRVLELARAQSVAEHRRVLLEAAEERAVLIANERAARREADTARAAAEAANAAKDQFLAMVSHELRNPLAPILNWTRLLRSGALDAERAQKAYESIERSATSQAQLIDDLLDVSRIVSGKLRMDVRPLDLAAIVHAVAETARPLAEARQIRIELALDPDAGHVAGDPERLQQVVWNLMSNAIKFTPNGGHVRVRIARVSSQVELAVSDTGQGIEPGILPLLFDRFWQGEAGTTRRQGGLGLGLSIVRHIVELHGGTVVAESEGPGRGALFRVRLPGIGTSSHGVLDEDRVHAGRGAGADATRAFSGLAGVKVLAVDDDSSSTEAIQAVLVHCGAHVRTAGSAEEALGVLEEWHPDVLISDIGMPGEDGYALIARVRARPAEGGGHVPALALTAYARAEDRKRALAVGFQMHIAKPVDPAELTAAVASLASRRDSEIED